MCISFFMVSRIFQIIIRFFGLHHKFTMHCIAFVMWQVFLSPKCLQVRIEFSVHITFVIESQENAFDKTMSCNIFLKDNFFSFSNKMTLISVFEEKKMIQNNLVQISKCLATFGYFTTILPLGIVVRTKKSSLVRKNTAIGVMVDDKVITMLTNHNAPFLQLPASNHTNAPITTRPKWGLFFKLKRPVFYLSPKDALFV